MKSLSRLCPTIVVALVGSTLSGCGAPIIECPTESMKVGEERTLTVLNVDDGLFWRQRSDDDGGGSFIVNGDARDEFRGGGSDTRIAQIRFRAERAGTVIITAEEVFIGPPISPLFVFVEFSTVACTITISD